MTIINSFKLLFSDTVEIAYREDQIGIPRIISNQQRPNGDPL